MKLTTALVRRPSPKLAEGLLTHLEPADVSADRALSQWKAYCEILRGEGIDVVEVPAAPTCPDSVFIEDPVFTYGSKAIMTRLKYPERQGESPAVRDAVSTLGFDVVDIPENATLEGGDIMKFGNHVWVGLSTRTNEAGAAALRDILADDDVEVTAVPVEHALHLKSAITALPDGTFLAHPDYAPRAEYFPGGYRSAPEFLGSQVILLGGDTVLMSDSGPDTADYLRAEGFNVLTTPMTEFEKTEGCVTCLSVRIRR